jgi:hypothetical protein
MRNNLADEGAGNQHLLHTDQQGNLRSPDQAGLSESGPARNSSLSLDTIFPEQHSHSNAGSNFDSRDGEADVPRTFRRRAGCKESSAENFAWHARIGHAVCRPALVDHAFARDRAGANCAGVSCGFSVWPPAPERAGARGGAIAVWLTVPWAAWADRHRRPFPEKPEPSSP